MPLIQEDLDKIRSVVEEVLKAHEEKWHRGPEREAGARGGVAQTHGGHTPERNGGSTHREHSQEMLSKQECCRMIQEAVKMALACQHSRPAPQPEPKQTISLSFLDLYFPWMRLAKPFMTCTIG